MNKNQIALTLYTLRKYCRNEADLKSTLIRVKDIGYRAIQISGVGVMSPEIIRRIAEDVGLIICATHEPAEQILNQPKDVVKRLNQLGCMHTAFPFPQGYNLDSKEVCLELARKLDHSGQVLRQSGKILSYHNHDLEFVRYGNQSILEIIFNNTNPLHVQGELDTFWVQKGGEDPVTWCQKLKGRMPLLHLKDYVVTLDREVQFGEIGAGNLNWKRIIAEADEGGCEWFIVEQDTCTNDPFDSIRISYEYLIKMASL